jgi:hypothetical protein
MELMRRAATTPRSSRTLVESSDVALVLCSEVIERLFVETGYDTTVLLSDGCVIVDAGHIVRVSPRCIPKTIAVGRRTITRDEFKVDMRRYRAAILVGNDTVVEERLRQFDHELLEAHLARIARLPPEC